MSILAKVFTRGEFAPAIEGARLLPTAPAAVAARTGWLIEAKAADWSIPEAMLEELESLLGRGPVKLAPGAKETRGWNSKWKLYLPEEEGEVRRWISQA